MFDVFRSVCIDSLQSPETFDILINRTEYTENCNVAQLQCSSGSWTSWTACAGLRGTSSTGKILGNKPVLCSIDPNRSNYPWKCETFRRCLVSSSLFVPSWKWKLFILSYSRFFTSAARNGHIYGNAHHRQRLIRSMAEILEPNWEKMSGRQSLFSDSADTLGIRSVHMSMAATKWNNGAINVLNHIYSFRMSNKPTKLLKPSGRGDIWLGEYISAINVVINELLTVIRLHLRCARVGCDAVTKFAGDSGRNKCGPLGLCLVGSQSKCRTLNEWPRVSYLLWDSGHLVRWWCCKAVIATIPIYIYIQLPHH